MKLCLIGPHVKSSEPGTLLPCNVTLAEPKQHVLLRGVRPQTEGLRSQVREQIQPPRNSMMRYEACFLGPRCFFLATPCLGLEEPFPIQIPDLKDKCKTNNDEPEKKHLNLVLGIGSSRPGSCTRRLEALAALSLALRNQHRRVDFKLA